MKNYSKITENKDILTVEYADSIYAKLNNIPTKTSDLTNNSGFITSDGSVKSVIDYGDTSKKIKIGYSGTGITGDNIKYIAGFTTGDREAIAKIKDISKDAMKSWLGYATVATSGSYKDLTDTPTIPPTVTESTVSGWGFTKNAGTITGIKMNGSSKGTSGVVDLGTVITADGGTINKSKTVKMDASANSNGANLKWGTVNSKNPYIGYASDQTDGTFVVGSLLGTNYASGLAIGGGSGNLLWKGAKVATTSDIPNISGKLDKTAFSLSGTTLTITI